ncbi:MAG: D-glycero-beta-D-manno-heptose-7-phosphate kinase [Candidatus Polarisedimenticolia bacterium]|nr:D-glycero-beta-D-manno-heptose-7-phosphate kinase [bacterium]
MSGDAMDERVVARFAGKKVLVVGDVILDRYVKGSVDRISPEAPVPVVRIRGEEHRPGGAANVAANLAALGAAARLVSVVGEDAGAARLASLARSLGIDDAGLLASPGRPTTVKTRVVAHHQQVVRLDQEDDRPIGEAAAARALGAALAGLDGADALIVSDYAKGLLVPELLAPLLETARAKGVPVVVDPKARDFSIYQPATVLTPNLLEASRAAGRDARGDGDVSLIAEELLAALRIDALLVTLGEAGMLLLPRSAPAVRIPAQAREVYDVTGAGDTVVAVLGAGLAAGLPLEDAARWANAAAAVAVGRLGTAAVSAAELAAFGRGI